MKVRLAHFCTQGISFAVFNADARINLDSERARLLLGLTLAARGAKLKVDKSALVFILSGKTQFYGTPDLVNYLALQGMPRWTHTIIV